MSNHIQQRMKISSLSQGKLSDLGNTQVAKRNTENRHSFFFWNK